MGNQFSHNFLFFYQKFNFNLMEFTDKNLTLILKKLSFNDTYFSVY